LNLTLESYQNTSIKEGGIDMKNIRCQGYCPVCKRFYVPRCPHGVHASYYFVDFSYKGTRFIRGTNLDGKTLRTLKDVLVVQQKIEDEIRLGGFNLSKWTSKIKPDYMFQVLNDKWYEEKLKEEEYKRLRPGYTVKLRLYRTYFDYFHGQDVRSIFNVKDFALQLPKRLSLKYQKNIVTSLMGFFRWCKENRYISEVPIYPKIKIPKRKVKTLKLKECLKILCRVPQEHQPIFTFLFFQGARPSEVRALKWDCINDGLVVYKRTFSLNKLMESTKELDDRENPIFKEVMAVLPKRGFPLDFVFTHGRHLKRHYGYTMLSNIFKKAAKEAGFDINLYNATKHSFGTHHRKMGVPLDMIQAWFGHKSIKSTEIYATPDIESAFKEKVGRIG
jgi:integrase